MSENAPPPAGSAVDRMDGAKEAEHEIARQAQRGGAAAFEFNANASPEEKAAQAKKVCLPNPRVFRARQWSVHIGSPAGLAVSN